MLVVGEHCKSSKVVSAGKQLQLLISLAPLKRNCALTAMCPEDKTPHMKGSLLWKHKFIWREPELRRMQKGFLVQHSCPGKTFPRISTQRHHAIVVQGDLIWQQNLATLSMWYWLCSHEGFSFVPGLLKGREQAICGRIKAPARRPWEITAWSYEGEAEFAMEIQNVGDSRTLEVCQGKL